MTLQPLYFIPGVCKSASDYANSDQQAYENGRVGRGRYIDGNFYRFYAGFPEKLGGWVQNTSATVNGVPRGTLVWRDNNQIIRQAIGTHLKLYHFSVYGLQDITPRRAGPTGTLTNALTTASGSATVLVSHTAHGQQTGDYVTLTASVGAFNGVLIANTYPITVLNANQYTVQYVAAATGTGSDGGTTSYTYYRATLTNPFTTTLGSSSVTVTQTAHGASVSDFVTFSASTAVGGLTISGEYQIVTTSTNSYTIMASSAATSAATGGGTVTVQYNISSGLATANPIGGYGQGGYGLGGYGQGGVAALSNFARTWSLDTYGQQLLACPFGGQIYVWDPSINNGISRAYPLYGAPSSQNFMFVTPERIVVGLGTNGNSMQMSWSDQTSYNIWSPAIGNTANIRTLSGGSYLVSGTTVQSGVNMVWSDTTAFNMNYTGDNSIYQTPIAGKGVGTQSPLARCVLGNVVYWMGDSYFWMWNGSVTPLPADDVRAFVFSNVNLTQSAKFFAGTNRAHNEVWFFYVSNASTEIDSYAIFHVDQQCWSLGQLNRTCWADRDLQSNPTALDVNGYFYNHEVGVDANGSPMNSYVTLAPLDVAGGEQTMTVVSFVPDFQRLAGPITLALNYKYYPMDSNSVYDAIIQPNDKTPRVDLKGTAVTGRMVGYTLASNTLGGDWRLGVQRVDLTTSGARR